MVRVKVSISDEQDKVKLPSGIRLTIRRCCHAVLEYEKFQFDSEVSVTFIDDNEIKILNNQYRKKDMPTDVLSFPLCEKDKFSENVHGGVCMLGDVVISAERAFRQADIYEHSVEREIAFLTVHSMLHLLGYDHENSGLEARIMREKEEAILSQVGLTRD